MFDSFMFYFYSIHLFQTGTIQADSEESFYKFNQFHVRKEQSLLRFPDVRNETQINRIQQNKISK